MRRAFRIKMTKGSDSDSIGLPIHDRIGAGERHIRGKCGVGSVALATDANRRDVPNSIHSKKLDQFELAYWMFTAAHRSKQLICPPR
jgi:hypothetical protein